MELVKGGELEEQHRKKQLTMRETQVLIYQVLDALSHIHSCGIIHHDINTYNILVSISWSSAIPIHYPNLICLPHSCRDLLS